MREPQLYPLYYVIDYRACRTIFTSNSVYFIAHAYRPILKIHQFFFINRYLVLLVKLLFLQIIQGEHTLTL